MAFTALRKDENLHGKKRIIYFLSLLMAAQLIERLEPHFALNCNLSNFLPSKQWQKSQETDFTTVINPFSFEHKEMWRCNTPTVFKTFVTLQINCATCKCRLKAFFLLFDHTTLTFLRHYCDKGDFNPFALHRIMYKYCLDTSCI